MLRNYTRLINIVGGTPFFVLLLFLMVLPAPFLVLDLAIGTNTKFDLITYQFTCAVLVFAISQIPWRKRKAVIHRLKSKH